MNGKNKKCKKKKGNQSKQNGYMYTIEDAHQTKPNDSASNVKVLLDNYHDSSLGQNRHDGALSNVDSQIIGVSESDVEQEKLKNFELRLAELQDEINKLEVEKTIWSQKEGCLEEKIKLLQNDVNSCIHKEASLEDRLKKMEDVMSHSFEEVKELKEYRDILAQENKQLIERISSLESRIQQLETAASFYTPSKINGEVESHLNEINASENPDILSEHISEEESLHHALPAENSAGEGPAEPPSMELASEIVQESTLEFNQKMAPAESELAVVPLSDAPLIGAPFRLISFFARYVSGADLAATQINQSGQPAGEIRTSQSML